MKKLILMIALTVAISSCSKDEEPIAFNENKVIDKVAVQFTNTATLPENYTSVFEYNNKKEITKISLFRNGGYNASYTYSYQNNIPLSAIYDNPEDNDNYLVNYDFTNGVFKAMSYPSYNTVEPFTYNETLNEYAGSGGNLQFRLNAENDIFQKTFSTNTLDYSFDSTKKGPLFNVANKKWIPTLWFAGRLDNRLNNVTTSFPVTKVTSSDTSTTYNYSNTYDADGFITKSTYSNLDGSVKIDINFTYKTI